jgi:hypothetical protein
MKWPLVAVLFGSLAACRSNKQDSPSPGSGDNKTTVISLPKAALTDGYKADIATLCDVVHLSEADKKPKDERWPIIAMWLGPHITTTEGHDFLVAIQPLQGEAKALALETEANRVGLTTCALVAEWREPG